jgi:hypothetical protein
MPHRLVFAFLTALALAGCRYEPAPLPAASAPSVLFPVQQHGRWGYIDRAGTLVIPPQFERAWRFSEGLALVEVGGRFGYINTQGKAVIAPQFDDALYFSDGLAPVQQDSTWFFIDPTGRRVEGKPFDLDPALLEEGRYEPKHPNPVKVANQYGFMNAAGQMIIPPRFDRATHFADSLARVQVSGKWGFINPQGTLVIPPGFDQAWDFQDGLALVAVDSAYGYIDRSGHYVWPPTR